MRIVVYDIAASDGGGTTILKQYIKKAKADKCHEWWFIVSISELQNEDTENVHVLYQEKLKQAGPIRWVCRFIFERTKLKKILKEINPDQALSLQNMPVPGAKCKQIVYLHQSLQFAPVRFSFFKEQERSCAFRQKVICKLIQRNLRKADEVIVQTKWMKEATEAWASIPGKRIYVETPKFDGVKDAEIRTAKGNEFFYPAGGHIYKNHQVIIKACRILKEYADVEFNVEFTMAPEDSIYAASLYEDIIKDNLPIKLIGYIPQKEVYEKYASKVLLFPSYIETYGLPLLEAKKFNAEMVVSDCLYAREVIGEYEKCQYVCWDNAQAWADAMLKCIKNNV